MEYRKKRRHIRHFVSIPFIWMVLPAFIVLDIFVEAYHRICFPLYGIPYVKRSSYILMDRHKLKYLRWYDKLNCAYCGYGNGLLSYATEITARTEKYWCSIKHYPKRNFHEPAHHKDFLEYGDEKTFHRKFSKKESRKKSNY